MAELASWNDTATRQAIEDYVASAPADSRVAVFDNDGTLWCEKPMPIQLDFILRRWGAMAAEDASLRERQPFKAAHERDFGWLSGAITKHYHGDNSDVKLVMAGVNEAFEGMSVDAYADAAAAFFADAEHPTLKRPYTACAYQPMVELLRYLEANGFSTFIASGGDRDFMRAIARAGLRNPGRARDRLELRPRVQRRGRARLQGRDRGVRRRPSEAGADLEPHGAAPGTGVRQLQRRHPDAAIRRWAAVCS